MSYNPIPAADFFRDLADPNRANGPVVVTAVLTGKWPHVVPSSFADPDNTWEHDTWLVTFTRTDPKNFLKPHVWTTEYRTGLGHRKVSKIESRGFTTRERQQSWYLREYGRPVKPTFASILECFISEAMCVNGETFAGFCDSLGYDTDSRRALSTYESCQQTLDALPRVLGVSVHDLFNVEF